MTEEMLKQLPDFDDMDKLATAIATAKAMLEDAKNTLEEEQARCIQDALTRQEFWIDNKPPTMGYCTAVVAVRGNTEADYIKLSELKRVIIESTKTYQEAKALLDNMKDRIAVWQTHSANMRKATF
jgi:hypothetical protein